MVTKTIKTLFFMVCALLLTLLLCKVRTNRQQEIKKERFEAGMRVASLMHSHDFRHLYPYLDSLHEAYPHDPQFYEIEGMARDYQGDRTRACQAYAKAIEKYDYLISTKHDFGDRINRAAVILFKDGKMAYYLALDEVLTHAKTQQEEQEVKMFREMDHDDILKQSFGDTVGPR
jgi:tetratricopeptide (TPR) repeat protein